ncbi:DNA-directed RNA polymerase, partial [Ascosphaera pollenicola]
MRSSFLTLALAALATAQTTSNCNPLKKTCPADPALGGHVDFDFKSKSDRFTSIGGEPSYGTDGATFTINKEGDAPTLGTKFYIMFGHVEIKIKASPGTGLVSSAILQSDDLDEIDWEWLGGDNGNVQSNYFGKGITGNYDRAAFHPVSDTQGQYHTYAIDWTKDRIQWIIDGNVVRTLTPQDADNGNQYPQSPMNIRIGSWAGGASENEGTVEWAGGKTDFSQAPFKMFVESLAITDYSTGQSYSYGNNSGTWQSIKSDGGKIEGT